MNWTTISADKWNKALGEGSKVSKAFNDARKEGLSVEDAFNAALLATNSEAEREQLLRSTLNQMYGDSAKTYKDLNGNIIENNKAQADVNLELKDAMNKLEPLITKGKLFIAEVLEKAQPYLTWILDNIQVLAPMVLGFVGTLIGFGLVAKVITFINTIKSIGAASLLLGGKITLIIAAVAALVVGIIWLVKNWDKVKEVAEKVLNWIQEAWGKLGDWFSANVIEPIKKFFTDLWTGLKDGVTSAWEFVTGIFSTVATWINDNVVQPIAEFFRPAVEFFSGIITSIFNFYEEIITVIIGLAKGLWEIIQAVFAVVAEWFNENVIQPVSDFFKKMWNLISSAAQYAWNFIVSIWNKVSSWFNTNIIQPVVNVFTKMWDRVKEGASNAWNGIKSVFSKVADFFGDIFSKAWGKVKNIFSVGGQIFGGITDGITRAFTKVVNAIISGINRVIKVPFNFINGALNKIRNISILGVSPFADKWKQNPISVPQIPQLYEGGVLEKGKVGLLEGNGAEAVVPLQNNKKWINAVASDMQGALGTGNNEALETKLDTLITLLSSYLPTLSKRQLVTDTGAVIGAFIDPLDRALADKEFDRGRGR